MQIKHASEHVDIRVMERQKDRAEEQELRLGEGFGVLSSSLVERELIVTFGRLSCDQMIQEGSEAPRKHQFRTTGKEQDQRALTYRSREQKSNNNARTLLHRGEQFNLEGK